MMKTYFLTNKSRNLFDTRYQFDNLEEAKQKAWLFAQGGDTFGVYKRRKTANSVGASEIWDTNEKD